MTPLIAFIILTATGPTLSITLYEPSHIVSATIEYIDMHGEEYTLTAYPVTFVAEFPASATEPGVYQMYVDSATEEVETRGGGIIWNRYPIGYRMFKPFLHDLEPIPPPTTTIVITSWPKRSVEDTQWWRENLPLYHLNRYAAKPGWRLIEWIGWHKQTGRYYFLWEVTD